jgi:hypothetical protein
MDEEIIEGFSFEIVIPRTPVFAFVPDQPQPADGWHRCCCEIRRDDVVIDTCPGWAPPDVPFCEACEEAGHRPGPMGDSGKVMVPRIK